MCGGETALRDGESISIARSDAREKEYEANGLDSTYMFRVADKPEDRVIDATKRGGKARYINHSCDPNCESRIIKTNGRPRICLYSKRAIAPGVGPGAVLHSPPPSAGIEACSV